jgi:hypothetical protein
LDIANFPKIPCDFRTYGIPYFYVSHIFAGFTGGLVHFFGAPEATIVPGFGLKGWGFYGAPLGASTLAR